MKLVYIDSSVWIARFEGLPAYKKIVTDEMKKLGNQGWNFCISDAVILEVMLKPYKNNDVSVINAYNNVSKLSETLKSFPDVFKDAVKFAQTENLRAMDAIHVAIAKHHDCERFVSTDPHF